MKLTHRQKDEVTKANNFADRTTKATIKMWQFSNLETSLLIQ